MTSAEEQKATTPEKALQRLKEGNQRFVEGKGKDRDLLNEVEQTGGGQNPFAFILGCIDSRTPAETLFDEGIGDLFHGRVAGNVINGDLLGSMEFACAVAGTPLIVVMGHTSCGAVKGAINDVEMGNLTGLLHKIRPSIDQVAAETDKNDPKFADLVAEANVKAVMDGIREESEKLREMETNGEIGIEGCLYDVRSGKVNWL